MYGYGYLSDPPKNPRPKRFFARICENYRRSFKTFVSFWYFSTKKSGTCIFCVI